MPVDPCTIVQYEAVTFFCFMHNNFLCAVFFLFHPPKHFSLFAHSPRPVSLCSQHLLFIFIFYFSFLWAACGGGWEEWPSLGSHPFSSQPLQSCSLPPSPHPLCSSCSSFQVLNLPRLCVSWWRSQIKCSHTTAGDTRSPRCCHPAARPLTSALSHPETDVLTLLPHRWLSTCLLRAPLWLASVIAKLPPLPVRLLLHTTCASVACGIFINPFPLPQVRRLPPRHRPAPRTVLAAAPFPQTQTQAMSPQMRTARAHQ